jgi:osmotically-inducible protein OsmY
MHPYHIALQAAFCEIAADGKIVYHGHLGLGEMSLESAKGLIVAAAKLEEYRISASSQQHFQDLSLALRVQAELVAALDLRISGFEVQARSGDVHISGVLQFWMSEPEIVRVVEKVPGVTKVTTDLVVLPTDNDIA